MNGLIDLLIFIENSTCYTNLHAYILTVGMVHLVDIKFGDLAANAD